MLLEDVKEVSEIGVVWRVVERRHLHLEQSQTGFVGVDLLFLHEVFAAGTHYGCNLVINNPR